MDKPYFSKTLLVEDQGLTRQAMRALLVQSDPRLEIDEANDFATCTGRLAGGSYDLLLLDFHLGNGGSGLDVLKWICENDIAIHSVMLSAQDDRETILECIKAGASGFISKSSDGIGNIFNTALDMVLCGQVYLPKSALDHAGAGQMPCSAGRQDIDALDLSPRLAETLGYLCQGLSNKGIARKMSLSEHTVKEYSSDLLEKFHVRKRTELIVEMARRGIVMPRS
jgi:two-component system nitrate/nitrite response regulator NarL